MSRSSAPNASPTPLALERLTAVLEGADTLHALLARGLETLAEHMGTTPLLYLERAGRHVLYAAHGVGLSDDYSAMQPGREQLERLRTGEVLVLSTPGAGHGSSALEDTGCDGAACMLGVGLRSSGRLLGWVWLYQRARPSEAQKRVLSEFGAHWGAALEQIKSRGGVPQPSHEA